MTEGTLVVSRRGIVHVTVSTYGQTGTACGKDARDLVTVGAVGSGERMCRQCERHPAQTPTEPESPDFWSVPCDGDGGCGASAQEKCHDETGERPYGVHAQRTVTYFATAGGPT